MRLTLVISSLRCGGAERTASVLANAWAARGDEVTLITLDRDDAPAFPLHEAVSLYQLRVRGGAARGIWHGVMRQRGNVRALREAVGMAGPDVIVSFMDIPNVLTLLAMRGGKAPLIITEHIHPQHYSIGWKWEIARRLWYARASALVCVSEPLLDWFQRRTRVRGTVIANPVNAPVVEGSEARAASKESCMIAGMGRLVPQKGFDLLLSAFARIAAKHPRWKVRIIGDGFMMNELRCQARALDIAERVEFTGALADPFPALRAADLFVFSSRFEGFGNALCEAMACGLPAISFDCPSGPADIIRDGIDGLLVPAQDVSALARAMDRLMGDEAERRRLASRAAEVNARFGVDTILDAWGRLFSDLLVGRHGKA